MYYITVCISNSNVLKWYCNCYLTDNCFLAFLIQLYVKMSWLSIFQSNKDSRKRGDIGSGLFIILEEYVKLRAFYFVMMCCIQYSSYFHHNFTKGFLKIHIKFFFFFNLTLNCGKFAYRTQYTLPSKVWGQ